MFEAQLLIAKNQADGYEVYSPWFPKGGDNAEFTIDMVEIDNPNNITFGVEVLTKNSEDTGNGSVIASVSITTATGLTQFSLTAESTVKELVRYRYAPDEDSNSPRAWWLFRMLAPVWYDVA
jgi:hypothetical protein